jgi:chromosomal replication initiator protein
MISYLADKLRTNIREIEGVLKKINALVRFAKKEITMDLLEDVVREHSKRNQKRVSIELIRKTVGKFYDVTVDDLISNKRKKEITVPRQISMYLIKELTKNTHKEIGKAFNRDHSTVVNSLKKVKESLENDIRIEKEIKELKRILV